MTLGSVVALDSVDWRILAELSVNARLPWATIGRHVSLSPSAVAERVRRLEDAGVIRGYRIDVDLGKIGYGLLGLVRLTGQNVNNHALVDQVVARVPEVLECYRVTGSEGWVLKVAARDVGHLDAVITTLSTYGLPATSVVLSEWAPGRLPPSPEQPSRRSTARSPHD